MRAPGMTMHRLPRSLSTPGDGFLLVLVVSGPAGAITMLLTDANFGICLSSKPEMAAIRSCSSICSGSSATRSLYPDPAGLRHDQPHRLGRFSRKPVFGYLGMVYAMVAIGGVGFVVWAHHMTRSACR